MKSDPPCPRGAHTTDHHDADPRPHVAALLELSAFGWHVTEIRPDIGGGDAPVLWRVTIRRYDGYASITITEADPDAALDELARYAAVDADAPHLPGVVINKQGGEAGREAVEDRR
jgi:hypothetical protein